MLDAWFGVIPKPPRWHAFCTMEEYQSNARVLHLSLLLPMSYMSLVPRPKIAFTMAESTCCRLQGPAAITSGGTLRFRYARRVFWQKQSSLLNERGNHHLYLFHITNDFACLGCFKLLYEVRGADGDAYAFDAVHLNDIVWAVDFCNQGA